MKKKFEALTYKPGYDITVVFPDAAYKIDGMTMFQRNMNDVYAHMLLKVYLPDSTKFPHDLTLIQFQVAVPLYMESESSASFENWARHVFRHFEMHEVDEWLKMDGQMIHNPHANDPRPTIDG